MINMGYCRFENTLDALYECERDLSDGKELSESEEAAKQKLLRLCSKLVEEYGDEQ